MDKPDKKDCFMNMGISSKRYIEVWSALSGKAQRCDADHFDEHWHLRSSDACTFLTEMEAEVASINRRLVFVPTSSILSVDEDHIRMRSKRVSRETNLSHINNPTKALGPVKNAVCSSLTAVYIAGHCTRQNDGPQDIWERVVHLVQGAATIASLTPMPDTIFNSDRQYNRKRSILFVHERLQSTHLGTFKRGYENPFSFGDTPIAKHHKGMKVAERGCRALYAARASWSSRGEPIEASVYRESCGGRVASFIHNSIERFGSHKFALITRPGFSSQLSVEALNSFRASQDMMEQSRLDSHGRRVTRNSLVCSSAANGTDEEEKTSDAESDAKLSHVFLNEIYRSVRHLTLLQSEDPIWFLLRAFRFTSSTSHTFFTRVVQ